MCTMSQILHEGEGLQDEVFRLSHDARKEILLVIILWRRVCTRICEPRPMSSCSALMLRTLQLGSVSLVSKDSTLELLGYADHRGFYTCLQPQLSAYLDQFSQPGAQEAPHMKIPPVLSGVFSTMFAKFSEERGTFPEWLLKCGFRVHAGFELRDGPAAISCSLLLC